MTSVAMADRVEKVLAAAALTRNPPRRRLYIVATRRGRFRHLLEVANSVPVGLLCGNGHGDAHRTKVLLQRGGGTIRLGDCPVCAEMLMRHHAP